MYLKLNSLLYHEYVYVFIMHLAEYNITANVKANNKLDI